VAGNYGFLGPGFGLDRGFAWSDARARRSTLGVIPATSVRGAFRRLLSRALGRSRGGDTRARGADEITSLAIARIERARASGRPYFLVVNYFDAHERVLVPAPWDGAFSPRPARPTAALFETRLHEMNATGRVLLTPQERGDLVARYDETLAYVDASLDRLLTHAAGAGGNEATRIVVTADHGEAFGEHDTLGHGSTLYDEQVRVPLVVRQPGQRTGRVVTEPVGLAGVFALLTGAAPDLAGGDLVVSESFPLVPTPEKPGVRGGRALFSGPFVYLRGIDGRVEVFDVREDPGQARNLAGTLASGEAAAAPARLDAWIAAHPPVRSGEAPESRESREDRARLRALGYLR
jgi:arylsulfatase A-like enzyme